MSRTRWINVTTKPRHAHILSRPWLWITHTSGGQEFRGQTPETMVTSGSKWRLIKWDQTAWRRGFVWLSDLSSCVRVFYLSVCTCLCCSKTNYWFSNRSQSFWHWSLPLVKWVRLSRKDWGGREQGSTTSTPRAILNSNRTMNPSAYWFKVQYV